MINLTLHTSLFVGQTTLWSCRITLLGVRSCSYSISSWDLTLQKSTLKCKGAGLSNLIGQANSSLLAEYMAVIPTAGWHGYKAEYVLTLCIRQGHGYWAGFTSHTTRSRHTIWAMSPDCTSSSCCFSVSFQKGTHVFRWCRMGFMSFLGNQKIFRIEHVSSYPHQELLELLTWAPVLQNLGGDNPLLFSPMHQRGQYRE